MGAELVNAILNAKQVEEAEIFEQRKRVDELKKKLAGNSSSEAKHLLSLGGLSGQEERLDLRWWRLGV